MYLRVTISVLLLMMLVAASPMNNGKWIVDPQSRITIHGYTNVNSFTCLVDCYQITDTLVYTSQVAACQLVFAHNTMSIPVRNFDCGHQMITKDFRSTLKEKDFPDLKIHFRSLKTLTLKHDDVVEGVVDIVLAGVTKRYEVQYTIRRPDAQHLYLRGTRNVNFSDFKLTAPQRMMGLIQVQECLNVEFNLTLKALE